MESLRDLLDRLPQLDRDDTIYARRPWSGQSDAVSARQPDDGSIPQEASGLDYFLEVEIARDVAQRAEAVSGPAALEAVIYYAQNDAFIE